MMSSRDPVLTPLLERMIPLRLAGSILAAPEDRRPEFAARLAAAGAALHVDIIDDSYPRRRGVDPRLLTNLPSGTDIELHLMVRNPLRLLPDLLAYSPTRVAIQVEDLSTATARALTSTVAHAHTAGTTVWAAIAPHTRLDLVHELLDTVDGLLVMLTNPGTTDDIADIHSLDQVVNRGIPVQVDGGVTEQILPALRDAGVERAVLGRALWQACCPATQPTNTDASTDAR